MNTEVAGLNKHIFASNHSGGICLRIWQTSESDIKFFEEEFPELSEKQERV